MDADDTKQADILKKVKGTFEATINHPIYIDWYDFAYECEAFVEGRQWTEDEAAKIRTDYGVEPVTLNKISSRVRNAVGQEIQTRTKTVFRSRSGAESETKTAQVLTDCDYFFQDRNRSPFYMSQAFRHMLVSGLGWYEIEPKNGTLKESHINPLHVVWDVTDTTSDLTEQNVYYDFKFVTRDQAEQQFPDKKEQIEKMDGTQTAFPRSNNKVSQYMPFLKNGSYCDDEFDKIAIVRCFYREVEDVYVVVTDDGRLVYEFDKKKAYEIAAKGSEPIKDTGYCVYTAYFCGDVLLDHYRYGYQINPMFGWFPVFPVVGERETTTGIPYGVVRNAIDIQKQINATETRLNWYMRANQVIADGNAMDANFAETIRKEVNRADGVILKNQGQDIKIERHESKVQTHLARKQSLDKDLQDVMGIYDEALGVETNASSGIAIQKRQTGATRNLTTFFDKLRQARLNRGQRILPLMQQVLSENTVFYITDDKNAVKALKVNQPVMDANGKPKKDDKGNPIMENDVKTGEYDVYLEEVPDYSSQDDEWRSRALDISTKVPAIMTQPALFKASMVLSGCPQNILGGLMKDLFGESQQGQPGQPGQPQQLVGGAAPNGGQPALTQGALPPSMMNG